VRERGRWGPCDREDERIRRQGQDSHFLCLLHAERMSWRATSPKSDKMEYFELFMW